MKGTWPWSKPRPIPPYEVYRHRIRQYWEVKLALRQVEAQAAGMWPFQGSWLTSAQIEARCRNLERENRALLGDLLVLAVTLLGLSGAFIVLIEVML